MSLAADVWQPSSAINVVYIPTQERKIALLSYALLSYPSVDIVWLQLIDRVLL